MEGAVRRFDPERRGAPALGGAPARLAQLPARPPDRRSSTCSATARSRSPAIRCSPPRSRARSAGWRWPTTSRAPCSCPTSRFFEAAEEERYDLDLLRPPLPRQLRAGLPPADDAQPAGREGVPFHMVRIDIAGNISKKFSATGLRFPALRRPLPALERARRLPPAGRDPRPARRLPDGTTFFSVARTIRKHRGGYHAPEVLYSIGLGCDVESARRLVYADGMDLTNPAGGGAGRDHLPALRAARLPARARSRRSTSRSGWTRTCGGCRSSRGPRPRSRSRPRPCGRNVAADRAR